MPEERHFHFNILQSLWFVVFLVVVINLAKFAVNRWPVPGVTQLVNNV